MQPSGAATMERTPASSRDSEYTSVRAQQQDLEVGVMTAFVSC